MAPWPISPKLGTSVGCMKLIPWLCHFTSTSPSMTKKVRGGPEGVALPSIFLRDTVISTCPSITTYKKYILKKARATPGNSASY